jgi:hypothetical protein
MEDFRGEALMIGDLVAYARRQGSSLWLEQGIVTFGTGPYTGKLKVVNTKTGNIVSIQNVGIGGTVVKLAGAIAVPTALESSLPEPVQPTL